MGERNASLRSFRVAARASIMAAVYGVLNVIRETRTSSRNAMRRNGNGNRTRGGRLEAKLRVVDVARSSRGKMFDLITILGALHKRARAKF